MSCLNVEAFKGKSISEHRVEIVGRKGRGHPDFISDSVMDAVSIDFTAAHLREFGAVLHHHIDKNFIIK